MKELYSLITEAMDLANKGSLRKYTYSGAMFIGQDLSYLADIHPNLDYAPTKEQYEKAIKYMMKHQVMGIPCALHIDGDSIVEIIEVTGETVEIVLNDFITGFILMDSKIVNNYKSGYVPVKHIKVKSKSNNIKSLRGTFSNLDYVETIDLSELDATNILSLNSTFYNLAKLREVVFPNNDCKNLLGISETFVGCTHLESIVNLSKLDISRIDRIAETFSNTPFTELDLSGWKFRDPMNVVLLTQFCRNLTRVKLGSLDAHQIDQIYPSMFGVTLALKTIEMDLSEFDEETKYELQDNLLNRFSGKVNLIDISKL